MSCKDGQTPPDRPEEGNLPKEHREDMRPTPQNAATCDLCGGPVEEHHCKIVCMNCGYQRDCSDP